MGALLSFLGGSVFRAIWGELSAWLTARQEHSYELDRMRLQGELDAAQHQRNLEAVRLQAELGVKTIQVQGEARAAELEMEGWSKAVATATAPSGIWLVDLWNGVIRPAAASIALFLWVKTLNDHGYTITDWDKELIGVILGFYFCHRFMAANGK